ncbi:hypothetical protein HRI_000528900 [Hibiscus trionum]|uniref:Trichome birefringence-like N-terminal domain-containing protein n=1 Tax=Hibiscus trionum TaxID=183268 RepID=A0A9W7LL79_HIBTR|nr:hypothetical protein HRI_000528900 [Hibiscus trionum]
MKTRSTHSLGWKHIYMVLIMLILMAALLRIWRKGSSLSINMPSSQDPFTESSQSEQDRFMEPSPSREDQFVKSPSSAEDQFTDPSPSAQGQSIGSSPDDVSMSTNPEPEDTIEGNNSDAIMTEETKDEKLSFDSPLPMNPAMPSPTTKDNRDVENITYSSNSNPQVCNYAKGKWVADSRRPLYSGFGCKRWLPSPWACRLTQRLDFSYEGYRWEPINCQMPEFERFSFLSKMQDKTIAFIGDSLGRQQFHSLMCMATGGEDSPDVEDVRSEYGLIKRSGAIRPDGWAYRFPSTNTTILFYWSSTLCRLERINNTDPDSSLALHLDREPSFLTKFLHRFHVLVLNTAHHWIKAKFIANRWIMHVNRKPIKDGILMDMMNVKNYTVHRIVKWLDSQLPLHPGLKAFFRTRSPRHLDKTGFCNNTIPLTGGSEVFEEESSDKVVETAVKGTRVKILDITALSELRDEAHKSQYRIFSTSAYHDCLHWCLPGIPDTWNELLVAQL